MNASGVYNRLRTAHGAICKSKHPLVELTLDLFYACIKRKRRTIGNGVLCKCDRHAKGVDDARRFAQKRAYCLFRQVWLEGVQLLALDIAHVVHTVGVSALNELLHSWDLIVGKCNNERACVFVAKAKLCGKTGRHTGTFDVVFGLLCTGNWVVATVDDARVCARCTTGQVVACLQNLHRELVAHEFSGNRRTRDSCTNDDHVANGLFSHVNRPSPKGLQTELNDSIAQPNKVRQLAYYKAHYAGMAN